MAQASLLKMFLLLADLTIAAISAQIQTQPAAGTVLVPIDHRVTLSCTVDEEFNIDWEVMFADGVRPIRAALARNSPTFMQRNFIFTGVETSTSTLTFGILNEIGNQTNNATTIICVARLNISPQERGNETQVIFYSAPPPPTNLSGAENEQSLFNISWSLGFIEGVPVNYTLSVLNLNTTSAQPIIIAGLLDQHYVFEPSRPCDVYSITVTAVSEAGSSAPSEVFNFSINSNNDMCSTPEPTTDTNSLGGLSGGAIAGIVIGIIAVIVIGIITTITVVATWHEAPSSEVYQ